MKNDGREIRRSSGNSNEPAIQVICLGSGGGPSEDNVTGFLVRSTATNWSKNSVIAVDAGSHLAAITRILEQDFPLVADPETKQPPNLLNGSLRHLDSSSPATANIQLTDDESDIGTPFSEREAPVTITTLKEGAFAGLPFPHASARANALHVVREHISTYLITHPHLDHVSGFVINTAAFHNTSRPKRLAALPFTVNAIKTHIFNNVIWPNLTDEEGGVGLVTFQRLAEGGNIALGEGSGRGFIEVCDGLGVKGFKVSHGHCMRAPALHRGSNVTLPETPSFQHLAAASHSLSLVDGPEARSLSFSMPTQSAPGTPGLSGLAEQGRRASSGLPAHADQCMVDSTAYFVRTESTLTTPKREILIFGDVEPDSLSLHPRTALIWAEAAPKIALGILTGLFIEVSYTNATGDAVLFGHLAPRHLLTELSTLADMVQDSRTSHEREKEEARQTRKRKRASRSEALTLEGSLSERKAKNQHLHGAKGVDSPFLAAAPYMDDEMMTDYSRDGTGANTPNPHLIKPVHHSQNQQSSTSALFNLSTIDAPLKGLKVVIIHVKDTFSDGSLVGEQILKELEDGERELGQQGRGLGCVFEISRSGGSYWF